MNLEKNQNTKKYTGWSLSESNTLWSRHGSGKKVYKSNLVHKEWKDYRFVYQILL